MVADRNPRSYSYDEVAGVLVNLGFAPPRKGGGSHRKFRIEVPDPSSPVGRRGVIIGLVEKGHGTLKPKYITEMVRTLRENGLLPEGVEGVDINDEDVD
jgi:hypothetical protein